MIELRSSIQDPLSHMRLPTKRHKLQLQVCTVGISEYSNYPNKDLALRFGVDPEGLALPPWFPLSPWHANILRRYEEK